MIRFENFHYYVHRCKSVFFKKLFNYATSTIYETKQHIDFDETSDTVVLSLLQKKDIAMYLIAIKSFLHFVKVKKVIIVCDNDLTDSDKIMLQKHIKQLELYSISEFRHANLPKGGCWERLTAILTLTKDYYVIQLDADTLTLSYPDEVIHSVVNNRPFILGTEEKFNKKFTLNEISVIANEMKSSHVQPSCESELASLSDKYTYYIRGCAGFSGFPKNSVSVEDLIELSNIFQNKLKERWSEWGTEQFASNLLLSNVENVSILPIFKYTTPDNFNGNNTFLHFIGFLRFQNILYQKLALKTIKVLFAAN